MAKGFFESFGIASIKSAANALRNGLATAMPDTAIKADLIREESKLDATGDVLAELRQRLATERAEYEAVLKTYNDTLAQARYLQGMLDSGNGPDGKALSDADNAEVEKDLGGLVTTLEKLKPKVAKEKADADKAEEALNDAMALFNQRAERLKNLKDEAKDAKAEMADAARDRAIAQERAELQAKLAGLRDDEEDQSSVAIKAFRRKAEQERAQAETLDLKAKALAPAEVTKSRFLQSAQTAVAAGTDGAKSTSDRLKALEL